MKKKKLKNIISFLAFIVMIYLFILFGSKDYHVTVEDNVRFSNEYNSVSKNNVFVYTKAQEVLDFFNGKSGIVFMGFSSNEWCSYYAKMLNDIALEYNIDKIYYYDFKADRNINNANYQNIVSKLSAYLYKDDEGHVDLTAPSIMIIKNGEILYFDNEISNIRGEVTPEKYFTDYKENLFITNITSVLEEYLRGE